MNPHDNDNDGDFTPRATDATAEAGGDAGLFEQPPAQDWAEAPAPGGLRRLLFRLAGVDAALARSCPPDEQHQIARVGAAVLFGACLQLLLVFAAMVVILGTRPLALAGAAAATLVICGVLLTYDTLFVSGDWLTSGAAYAREYGIRCAGGARWKRFVGLAARWGMSFFIADVLAVFLALRMFAPDIAARMEHDNRAANAPLLTSVAARYDAVMADLRTRLTRADRQLDALGHERAQTVQSQAAISGADGEIAALVARIRHLQAEKAQALARHARYQANAIAEHAGGKLNPGNTGIAGDGPQFAMYRALAEQQARIAAAREATIAAATHDLAALRASRDRAADRHDARFSARLAELDRQLAQRTAARTALAHELKAAESNRAAWIARQMRRDPRHVARPTGLIAQVQTLWKLADANASLAALLFGLKVATILLETAGMVTKAFFTQCRVYSLRAALRANDACEAEGGRREGWAAWRERQQDRRGQALEPIRLGRLRRASRQRMTEMAHSCFGDRLRESFDA